MLRAKEIAGSLKRYMERANKEHGASEAGAGGGINNILLVTDEGAIVAVADESGEQLTYCSAVLASIYNEYKVSLRWLYCYLQ